MAPRCDKYERYEELLERTDIDAVEIATPDHWHALNTIHSCQASKDVYVQKPLSFTIEEAMKMERVAKDTKRVVQVGSQQRSSGRDRGLDHQRPYRDPAGGSFCSGGC